MNDMPDIKALEEAERALEQFRASERTHTDIPLPDGSTMSVEKISGPASGIHLEMEGGLSGRSYEPTEFRPDDYPADLPFVSGTAAAVKWVGGRLWGVTWIGLSDPEGARASIETQLQDAGWARAEEAAVPVPGTGMSVIFRKAESQRQLVPAGSKLVLVERLA